MPLVRLPAGSGPTVTITTPSTGKVATYEVKSDTVDVAAEDLAFFLEAVAGSAVEADPDKAETRPVDSEQPQED